MKTCIICNIEKDLSEFNKLSKSPSGYQNKCRECHSRIKKEWYERKKESDSNFLEERNRKSRERYFERLNSEPDFKEKLSESVKDYHENKKEDVNWRKERNRLQTERINRNPLLKFRRRLVEKLRRNIFGKGYKENSFTYKVLGCDCQHFKNYIESQFKEGMSWENYGEWHFDHIIPLSIAKSEDEVIKLCHHTNVQPLWWQDNVEKSNKIPEGYQIPL